MRVRRFLFDLAMAWLTIGCAVSYSRELAAVDPVLQAQWAEEVPAGEMVADDYYSDSTLECADAVDCGDEIGMASLIEPDVRLQGRW
jgi:hypothetical protein